MNIRPTNKEKDADKIWEIIHEVISLGDTWVFDPNSSKEKMLDYWFSEDKFSFVYEVDDSIAGIFFFKANQPDLGSHVANAGYMVKKEFRGQGIAEKMCRFSLEEAKKEGFLAMQFNLVLSTNKGAIKVWEKCGFQIIGTSPKAFRSINGEFIDTHIMYQWLG